MNDKDSIRNAISRNEGIAGLCGVMVLAGLALEIYWSPDWHLIVANTLVALGVGGEVWFGRRVLMKSARLDAILEKETAVANARAEEAKKRTAELERFTAWRRISSEQAAQLIDAIHPLASSLDLLVEYQSGDPEAYFLWVQIVKAFQRSGVEKVRGVSNSFVGGFTPFGLLMAVAPEVNGDSIHKALAEAIGEPPVVAEIDLSTHLPRNEVPPNLYIFIGPKPPPPMLWAPKSEAKAGA